MEAKLRRLSSKEPQQVLIHFLTQTNDLLVDPESGLSEKGHILEGKKKNEVYNVMLNLTGIYP